MYFNNEENRKRLEKSLNEWLGTPYRHRCCAKGLGTDCIHFVMGVFDDLGIVKKEQVNIPNYAPDWHLHTGHELLMDGITKHLQGRIEIIEVDKDTVLDLIKDGDIGIFHWGKADAHAAIYYNGFVYCAQKIGGVTKWNLKDAMRLVRKHGKITKLVRLI